MNRNRKKADYLIHDELGELLKGMESVNWTTTISKKNVKTVYASFRLIQPKVGVKIIK